MGWLLSLEAAILLTARWAARHGAFHMRRRTVICPLDGKCAHLTIAEEGTACDVLACSRLESAPTGRIRGCDRSCMRSLS